MRKFLPKRNIDAHMFLNTFKMKLPIFILHLISADIHWTCLTTLLFKDHDKLFILNCSWFNTVFYKLLKHFRQSIMARLLVMCYLVAVSYDILAD